MKIKLLNGKSYSFCSCGLSKVLPLCDNQHRKFNKENDCSYKSVKVTVKNDFEIDIDCSNWPDK
tara:strand:- start:101 stop:292 length:192 start_codon:yes stop_codon:yes gene_type:complete